MRVNRLVYYVALMFLPSFAFGWQKVSTNNDLYDPSNGDRISIYQNERGFIASAGSNNSSGINPLNQPEGEYVYHKTAKEAFESAVSNGYCGSKVDYSTLSCFTAPSSGTSATPSNTETGSSSTSGNSSGSSGGSGESTSGTTETQGLPDSLPIPETNRPELQKSFEDLRKRYAYAFTLLKESELTYKKDLAVCLDSCVLLYGGSDYHSTCAKVCHKGYDANMADLQKRFERLKQQMNEDIRKILESSKITPPSIPSINPDLSIPDISVSVGSGTGTSITNNSSETTNINNTTNVTNNNTSVHGGGGTTGGGTTNVTVNTKDYSGFLGSISGSLNDIKNKLVALVGQETKQQVDCSEDDGSLACSKLGSIDDAKMPDDVDFGIKTQTIDVSKHFNWERVVGGSQSCPAPIKINTPLFSKDIPLQPLCDFANMIRGVVILLFVMWGMRIALKGEN